MATNGTNGKFSNGTTGRTPNGAYVVCLYIISFSSNVGLEGRTLALIVQVPFHIFL